MTILVFTDYVSKHRFPNRVKNLLCRAANLCPKWMNMLPELAFNRSDLVELESLIHDQGLSKKGDLLTQVTRDAQWKGWL